MPMMPYLCQAAFPKAAAVLEGFRWRRAVHNLAINQDAKLPESVEVVAIAAFDIAIGA